MILGVLASGALGTIVLKQLYEQHQVKMVMTDKNSSEIHDFCKKNVIDMFIGNPRGGRCNDFIGTKNIDVIVSVNYIYIIEKELISLPDKIAFNIHGSLLPRYRGRTPHVWAIINNENQAGITAHLIDSGCDSGDIIEQIVLPIGSDETGADILLRYSQLYIPLINNVLTKIENNILNTTSQDHTKASYFGKRTPEDGRIIWSWQKERIKNWVRAQAFPYPGAFAFYKGIKFIIDQVQFDNFGFSGEMPDGLILSQDPLLVKTPNGVLKLSKVRDNDLKFDIGEIIQ